MDGRDLLKSSDPHIQLETIDKQEVLIPDIEGWELLKKSPEIDGVPLLLGKQDLLKIVWDTLEFVRKHPEFKLVLCPNSKVKKSWLPCVVLLTTIGWQRVGIEKLTCEVCNWQGATANPLFADLYVNVPDKLNVIKATSRHPEQPCPRCKNKLPRCAIWVEPIPL
jgi:hypothetical protein